MFYSAQRLDMFAWCAEPVEGPPVPLGRMLGASCYGMGKFLGKNVARKLKGQLL